MLQRFWSPAFTALVSTVLFVASSQTASAARFTFVGANLGCIPNGAGPDACPESDNGNEDGTFGIAGLGGLLQVTDETDGFPDANFDYLAKAEALFGVLRAAASGTFSGLAPNEPTSIGAAGAFAGVSDLLTITADGQAGSAMLDVYLNLDGTLQKTAGAGAFAWAGVTAGPGPDPFDPANEAVPFDSLLVVPPGPLVASVPFTWGQPFYLGLAMGVGAGTPVSCALCVGSGDGNPTPATTADGSATADFFSTLTLAGLVPRDDNDPNAEVRTAQYSSRSGAAYSLNGIVAQPVPEPGSMLLRDRPGPGGQTISAALTRAPSSRRVTNDGETLVMTLAAAVGLPVAAARTVGGQS